MGLRKHLVPNSELSGVEIVIIVEEGAWVHIFAILIFMGNWGGPNFRGSNAQEMTDHIKAKDSSDFRVPTEGQPGVTSEVRFAGL